MPATDRFLRDPKRMNVIFAFSCLFLLIVTVWMMAADHAVEWRGYQQAFDNIEAESLKEEQGVLVEQKFGSPENFKDVKAKLTEKINTQQQSLMNEQSSFAKLQAQRKERDHEVDMISRKVRVQRAFRDVARANYDLGISTNLPQAQLDELKSIFDKEQAVVDELEADLEAKEIALKEVQDEITTESTELSATKAELKEAESDYERLQAAIENVSPDDADSWSKKYVSWAKRKIMDWPVIDGFNSPHKIVNDWLPDLSITLGMAKSARFDRCRTCHLGIDRTKAGGVPAFPHGHPDTDKITDWVSQGKFPHPYSTHPRPDVYVSSTSPHPAMDGPLKFGCTICHDGNGSGTSFQNAEHGPNDPVQAHEWHKEYGYHSNHFWEYPMHPKRFIGSTCLKCHHSVVELGVNKKFGPTAPKVYKGFQLISQYGCFGCHEIHGYQAGKAIGPDLRLEPGTPEEAAKIAADPALVAGKMRKVGPSLRHISEKTTKAWTSYWTEEPKRFRPTTRMPQFFKLSNQQDELAHNLQPVEIAGITEYLFQASQEQQKTEAKLELLKPANGYQADATRGKDLFAKRGCLACHSHEAFPKSKADFGPRLDKVHSKLKPGEAGFNWLYTWIREPQRYHARTKMPNLYLEAYEEKGAKIDPAADIAAFLLEKGPGKYSEIAVNEAQLDELATLYLSKVLTTPQIQELMDSRKYPVSPENIVGDEIALATTDATPTLEEWKNQKLAYVGRRTISRYGCYGCHDIPGYETARPIGATLQDWGRKDPSKLAPEHIAEYLHHHGEPDGSSTHERVESAHHKMVADEFESNEELERASSVTFFYESLLHHGRPGFIWQKLRQPRSYDYKKVSTKGYDERLRMPKFPFNEEEIEAISAFVLGLVAEPPNEQYLYRPNQRTKDVIEGERLLQKYNCAGCHMVDLPEFTYAAEDLEQLDYYAPSPEGSPEAETNLDNAIIPDSLALLKRLRPPRVVHSKDNQTDKGETVIKFHGMITGFPFEDDPIEDQEYQITAWEPLDIDNKLVLPNSKFLVPALKLLDQKPARGGEFATWLVDYLAENRMASNRDLAWQMSPPPLYKEGLKVQTPWLFQFLQNPDKIRHTTVLRMPRFNMSPEEARSLANYFAAYDGENYPYQKVPQTEPEYVRAMNKSYLTEDPLAGYLDDSWKLLNSVQFYGAKAKVCSQCHSIAGGQVLGSGDPTKDIRGPNLQHVPARLRPDWTLLWLYQPKWITPYTSMPTNYPKGKSPIPQAFGGDSNLQTIAVRDALMNYHRLMEYRLEKTKKQATGPAPAKQPEN